MKKYFRRLCALAGMCLLCFGQASAQNMNFTQFPLAPVQSNPAMIATSNQTNIILNYRNQFISSGVSYESSMVSVTMPFMLQKTNRIGGFGVSAFQDRTGTGGIFTLSGAIGSFAYNHYLGETRQGRRYISAGIQGSYLQQSMNINAFQSGSQWNGSVFDANIPVNETIDVNQKSMGNFNAGLLYYESDTCDNVRSYVGITLQNINRPDRSFVKGAPFKMPIYFSFVGGYSVFNTDKIQAMVGGRYLRNGDAQEVRVGASGYYKVAGEEAKKLGASIWYDHNGSVSFALEANQPNYTIGFSYDMAATNVQNNLGAGAWELAVALKLGKKCRPKAVKVPKIEPIKDTVVTTVATKDGSGDSTYTVVVHKHPETLAVMKSDTIKTEFKLNDIAKIPTDEDLVIFKRVAYFYYRDDELNAATNTLLTDISNVMKKFKGIEIEVIGYSCNIGTEEENQTLSENRAKRTQKFLSDNGVDIKRIKMIGMGSKDPVMSNKMEYGRIKNRRVEFRVLRRGDEK